ncbi:MAG: LysM peptidoglycan-binding domain-containing protein, partial [Anaerolineae bacterium]|nr:LysM peptidoglycan-binding domain-containing protein [Anaerolineae bacterium]
MMRGRLLIFCTILMVIICGAFTTTATEAQAGGCSQTHIVQRGENLYRIALLYHTTIADLQARNAINNPNHIFAGQRLCVAGGFVPPATLTIPPNNTWDNIGIVTVYRLNIRSGPGIQYPIVRLAAQGEGLRLVGRSTDSRWYQALDDPTSGRFVWVSAAYVQAPYPE